MTWTAPVVDRAPSPRLVDERASLVGWLDFHRQTLLMKCAGLTHEQLATRSVEPSGLSLLGLVRHMAEVERWWFVTNLHGQEHVATFGSETDPDGDFTDLDSMPAEQVFEVFARECATADASAADLPLETRFTSQWRTTELDLRWIYVHMIEEYARHNGHADLLRERIDGVTGD